MRCVTLLQKAMYSTHIRQIIVLLFYIILWFEQVAGNIMENGMVYCQINVRSCFVMVLKFYIFGTFTQSGRRRGVLKVRRVATLPMSCCIVQKITTRSVPQSYAGYLRTSQPLAALWCEVSTEFPFCTCSNLWSIYMIRVHGIFELNNDNLWVWRGRYVGCSSWIVDVTGGNEMLTVSVSRNKVLLFLDIESMVYSVLQSLFRMDLRVTKFLVTKNSNK